MKLSDDENLKTIAESPDKRSKIVCWIVNYIPPYYKNWLVLDGVHLKSTEFSSRGPAFNAVYDETTGVWSGDCYSGNELFRWRIVAHPKEAAGKIFNPERATFIRYEITREYDDFLFSVTLDKK